jgi:hypothetical protein
MYGLLKERNNVYGAKYSRSIGGMLGGRRASGVQLPPGREEQGISRLMNRSRRLLVVEPQVNRSYGPFGDLYGSGRG